MNVLNNDEIKRIMRIYACHCSFLERIAAETGSVEVVKSDDLLLLKDGAKTLIDYIEKLEQKLERNSDGRTEKD